MKFPLTIKGRKKEGLEKALEYLDFIGDGLWEIEIRKPQRTDKQNNSIHKYCELVANELNEAGITKQDAIPLIKVSGIWSMQSVKEDIWKAFQWYLGLGDKTSKLKTNEVTQVYELTNQFLGEKLKTHIPFPDKFDNQLLNS